MKLKELAVSIKQINTNLYSFSKPLSPDSNILMAENKIQDAVMWINIFLASSNNGLDEIKFEEMEPNVINEVHSNRGKIQYKIDYIMKVISVLQKYAAGVLDDGFRGHALVKAVDYLYEAASYYKQALG